MSTAMTTNGGRGARGDPLREALREIVQEALRSEIAALQEAGGWPAGGVVAESDEPRSWRERLWTCHGETRLDVAELSAALGRPRSAIYKLTSAGTIPHRKDLSGSLTFVAGEVRCWIRDTETSVVEGESWTPADQRRPHLRAS